MILACERPAAAKRPPQEGNSKTAGQWPGRWQQYRRGTRPLLRGGRQRNRILRKRAQVIDHVGALAVPLDAGKAQRGAGNEPLGVGDKLVQIVERPFASFGLHGGGIVETGLAGAITPDDPVKIGPDAILAA